MPKSADPSQYFDPLETRPAEEREGALMARLPRLIERARSDAPGWAVRLAGVDARAVSSRKALAQLPVLRKADLKRLQENDPPFAGLVTTKPGRLARLFVSPGPIIDVEGVGEDPWRAARAMYAAGIRAGHVVQNCFSYHMTPGAWMIDGAARKIGCAVIPAGTGQTEQQVELIRALRPDAYTGTPSFLRIIVERARELALDISNLKRALLAAEALPPSLRAWFRDEGIDTVLQWYGTADVGLIAYESEALDGMIVDEDLILEIVRPGTGDPVVEGEVGEVVVTSFSETYPLIRFGTGDLSAMLSGISPCGRTNVRIRGWLGRADQTTKVRGMFVHPEQVAEIVRRTTGVQRARLVVAGEMANDRMTLKCEVDAAAVASAGGAEAFAARLADAVREVTKLRGEVELVDAGSLPNDGKVIEDARTYE